MHYFTQNAAVQGQSFLASSLLLQEIKQMLAFARTRARTHTQTLHDSSKQWDHRISFPHPVLIQQAISLGLSFPYDAALIW